MYAGGSAASKYPLCKADFSDQLFKRLIKTFLGFERLDKSWAIRLKKIKNNPVKKQVNEQNSIYCEQFLVNELFRHLSDAEDTMWVRARAIACVLAWCVVQSLVSEETGGDDFELIKDVVRAYSAEVEYSQKNLDRLFAFAEKFIKI